MLLTDDCQLQSISRYVQQQRRVGWNGMEWELYTYLGK